MDKKQIEKIPKTVTIEFSERTVRQCKHYNRSEACDGINKILWLSTHQENLIFIEIWNSLILHVLRVLCGVLKMRVRINFLEGGSVVFTGINSLLDAYGGELSWEILYLNMPDYSCSSARMSLAIPLSLYALNRDFSIVPTGLYFFMFPLKQAMNCLPIIISPHGQRCE